MNLLVAGAKVPHQRAVRDRSGSLSTHRCRRPSARSVPGALVRPELAVEPGPGPAEQHDPPGRHQVAAAALALVRNLVLRRGEALR